MGTVKKSTETKVLEVIVEESTPSLKGWLANTDHVLGDARLTDVDAEFQQFPVERGAPQSGFSRLMVRMSGRTSFEILGRPDWPR